MVVKPAIVDADNDLLRFIVLLDPQAGLPLLQRPAPTQVPTDGVCLMKNLKLIVATCASIAALGAVPTVHAQDGSSAPAATSPSRQSSTPAPTRPSRRPASNDNGCTGPASFCSTYFGN